MNNRRKNIQRTKDDHRRICQKAKLFEINNRKKDNRKKGNQISQYKKILKATKIEYQNYLTKINL